MGIPALGELPSSVVWAGIIIITAGVYLASGGPLPTLRLRPSGWRAAAALAASPSEPRVAAEARCTRFRAIWSNRPRKARP